MRIFYALPLLCAINLTTHCMETNQTTLDKKEVKATRAKLKLILGEKSDRVFSRLHPITISIMRGQFALDIIERTVTSWSHLDLKDASTVDVRKIYMLEPKELEPIFFSTSCCFDGDLEPMANSTPSNAIANLIQRLRLSKNPPYCAQPAIFTAWIMEKHASLHGYKKLPRSYDEHYALSFLEDLEENESLILAMLRQGESDSDEAPIESQQEKQTSDLIELVNSNSNSEGNNS
jgi:hypothetical protein